MLVPNRKCRETSYVRLYALPTANESANQQSSNRYTIPRALPQSRQGGSAPEAERTDESMDSLEAPHEHA